MIFYVYLDNAQSLRQATLLSLCSFEILLNYFLRKVMDDHVILEGFCINLSTFP